MRKIRKNQFRRLFIILVFIGMQVHYVSAQQNEEKKPTSNFHGHWLLQLNGGLTEYFGDLNADNFYNKNMKLGLGGSLGYQLNPVFRIRGQFVTGKLYSERETHALKLNTDFWDASLNMTVNLNEIFAEYNSERFFNIYLFGGGGLTSFSSTTSDLTTGIVVDKSKTRQNEFFVPVGIGTSFRLSKRMSLVFEYGDHITFKDKTLDFTAENRKRDHYSYASAGLGYKFGGMRDTDKDGVMDKDDLCPDVPGKIELAGCPDKDNDGVADKDDDCPDVPGIALFKGCPDSDGDGIPDKDDKCPTEAGKKEFAGCPDKDNDGIPDNVDRCPDVAGLANMAGCPDKDGDGIADIDDDCPDAAGLAQLHGCPDKDGDGIADKDDKCPDVPGTLANNGCPEATKMLFENKVVYFGDNKADVLEEYKEFLNQVVQMLKDNPEIKVRVTGHTDSRESIEYNLRLSEKRADAVVSYLVANGVDKSKIVKEFYGEARPVGDNRTAEGRQLNRRVMIEEIK